MKSTEITKEEQLKKLATFIKRRREALGYSVRELEKNSGVSKALISKIENCQISNFPKDITLKLLNKGLKCKQNELLILANIFSSDHKKELTEKKDLNWQEKLREFLAIETDLNSCSIDQIILFSERVLLFQKITDSELGEKYPELKALLEK